MSDTAQIKGVDSLIAAIQNVKDEHIKKTFRAAVAAGARIVRDKAKANAIGHGFRRSGNLIRNIVATQRRVDDEKAETVFSVYVKTRGSMSAAARAKAKAAGTRDAFYWRFLEFGWNHRGTAKRKSGVPTTPIPAKPFLQPALPATQDRVIQAMEEAVKKSIAKYGSKSE